MSDLNLNRFEFDLKTMTRKKLNSRFEFPDKFDFGFLGEEQLEKLTPPHSYQLTGVIVHTGVADSGHYVSYVWREGKWFEFNDSNVTVKSDNLVSS